MSLALIGQALLGPGAAAAQVPPSAQAVIAAYVDNVVVPTYAQLLHDLGPDLADNRPDFEASGPEWRTAPLWGIGLTETVLAGSAGYLHNGRARTLDEAILWHGGETESARDWFRNASADQRAALIALLRSH